MALLDWTQDALASKAGVPQPWLSKMFKGTLADIDTDRLRDIAAVLIESLQSESSKGRVSEEQARDFLVFLGRFVATEAVTFAPGDVAPVGATEYIDRAEDGRLLQMLQKLPFVATVRGPVQCGKSSLLKRVEAKAKAIGVQTAWFDTKLSIPDTARKSAAREYPIPAFESLYEQLLVDWEINPYPLPVVSPARLTGWLHKELKSSRNSPRMLIVDDVSYLEPAIADDLIRQVLRPISNLKGDDFNISLAAGITYQYGAAFERRLMRMSSDLNSNLDLDLKWFKDVSELCAKTKTEAPCRTLMQLFKGQPYLTHAAIHDEEFSNALLELSEQIDEQRELAMSGLQKAILVSKFYEVHLRAIKKSLFGPHLEPDPTSLRMVEAFHMVCESGDAPPYDERAFLTRAHLIERVNSTNGQLTAGELSEAEEMPDVRKLSEIDAQTEEERPSKYEPKLPFYRRIAQSLYQDYIER